MNSNDKIWILTTALQEELPPESTQRSGEIGRKDTGTRGVRDLYQKVAVHKDQLAANLKDFMTDMQGVFGEVTETAGSFEVDEIELQLSVNAKGGIELIGKVETGVKAGILLRMKRRKD